MKKYSVGYGLEELYVRYDIQSLPMELYSGDTITFRVDGKDHYYTVHHNHLNCGGDNGRIFDLLGIVDKFAFAGKAYGYSNTIRNSHQCPQCQNEDYEALTRLCWALFDRIR